MDSQSKSFYHLAPTLWNDLPLAVREVESESVEMYLKIDWTSIGEGTL